MTDGPMETQNADAADMALVTRLRGLAQWVPSRDKADELGNVASAVANIIRERDRLQSQVLRVAVIVEEDPDTNPQVRRIYEVLDEV